MLPKMRTIKEVIKLLREQDPDTCLTETALRRLVISGALPSVRVGAKYLLDIDRVGEYLRGTAPNSTSEAGIRRIQL